MSGALLIHLNLGVDKDLNDPMQNGEPRDLLVALRNITQNARKYACGGATEKKLNANQLYHMQSPQCSP